MKIKLEKSKSRKIENKEKKQNKINSKHPIFYNIKNNNKLVNPYINSLKQSYTFYVFLLTIFIILNKIIIYFNINPSDFLNTRDIKD